MTIELRPVGPGDAALLARVADGVFDGPVDPRWTRAFLDDPRHHLIVALDDGLVVGMITALDYVHPDKAPQLWINEAGVAPSHHRRGIGRRLVEAMLAHGRAMGCTEAWLGTEEDNVAARALYRAARGAEERCVIYTWELAPADPPGTPGE